MSGGAPAFHPSEPLVSGVADRACRAIVTIPARNEEQVLSRCLDALAAQVTLRGEPLAAAEYEVLLLLNNITDRSAEVARRWQEQHLSLRLCVLERTWPAAEAHVGTARRALMDTAWARLQAAPHRTTGILATDADSVVAPDWIAQNLRALAEGADVVGGELHLLPADLAALPSAVQRRYRRDRQYASLVARLEDALDPQAGDRCPRHLDHFGASLACLPQAYAAAGGMPMLAGLEDEAFIDGVRRANGRLRHDPRVRVYTSARLQGRAAVGMAGQLRMWNGLPSDEAHTVSSAAFLAYRFRYLQQLRRAYGSGQLHDLVMPTEEWRGWVLTCLQNETTCPDFFRAVNSEALVTETFAGSLQQPIQEAIAEMKDYLDREAGSGMPSGEDPDAGVGEAALSAGSRQ